MDAIAIRGSEHTVCSTSPAVAWERSDGGAPERGAHSGTATACSSVQHQQTRRGSGGIAADSAFSRRRRAARGTSCIPRLAGRATSSFGAESLLLLPLLLLLLLCAAGGASAQGFSNELFSILLNQGGLDPQLSSVNVAEFGLEGVQDVLSKADGVLHAGRDTGAQRSAEALQQLVASVKALRPTGSTYPVTRRLVTAVVRAKQRELVDATGSEAAISKGAAAIRKHFMELMRAGRRNKGDLVHFFHIPKTGGTTLCKVAIEKHGMGGNEAYTKSNCHVRVFNDFGSWANYNPALKHQFWMRAHWTGNEDSPHATCELRERHSKKIGVRLHANEYVLPDTEDGRKAEVCPQFTNLVMMRNPISRAVSNIMHLRQMYRWNNATDQFPNDFFSISQLAPRIVNNFYIRTLLGTGVFQLPYDAITEQHLQAAKLKLLQFDVLLLLEEPAKDDVILAKAMDWNGVGLADRKANSLLSFVPELTGQESFERLRGTDFPLDEIVYSLGQSNYLDMVLYVFARRLFEVDYAFFASV